MLKFNIIKLYDSKRILYSPFFEGYFYAQLGERLTNGKVTEHTLDLAKETAQTCIEQQIAYSGFDEKQ